MLHLLQDLIEQQSKFKLNHLLKGSEIESA
jgi:hypothetical protein